MSGNVGRSLGDPGSAGPPGLPGARMRVAGPGDAAALVRLKNRLDRETSFMLLEAAPSIGVPGGELGLALITRPAQLA